MNSNNVSIDTLPREVELCSDFYEESTEIVSIPDTNLAIALHRKDEEQESQELASLGRFLEV